MSISLANPEPFDLSESILAVRIELASSLNPVV